MKTPLPPIPIDRTHGGSAPERCIDFSTSLNPLGPPAEAIDAYHQAIANISKYPSPYPRRLEARIAAWVGVGPERLIAGNGSTQLIYLTARVLRPHSPFVVIPCFSEIANALIASGSRPFPISTKAEDNFRFEHAGFRVALENGADAVFLSRPVSPTGMLMGLDEAAGIARECERQGAWCVVDEAFIEFADDPVSLATLIGSFGKLVVLRSLTKIFAIPGLRLGYLLGPTEFIQKLRQAIEPWSVNAIAEHVALACLDVAERFIALSRRQITEERERLVSKLERLPALRLFPSTANFVMFAVVNEQRCGEFGDYLSNHGIAIRDLSDLPGCGSGLYRIGIRSRSDNDRFVTAATEYVGRR
jgi:threonine-phosphate decarboxylase